MAGKTSFALTMIVYKSMYVTCGILVLILILILILVLPYRQDVVIVGAGRYSRSAKFVTSSELLYLLNLLYNMPSECCDEHKLIQLYQKSSVWCFAFSHTSTFELIPAVATAQAGALVTILVEILTGTYIRITLSDLTKYSMTRNVARFLGDS